MFCDIVDSVVLSTRLDPEDLRDLISAYQRVCTQSARFYDGYIARYVGDGVLIYFGYPAAHEDDAERAICAALDILAAIARFPENLNLRPKPQIRIRIGIATGIVVVGDAVGGEVIDRDAVVGEAVNLAARLQNIAKPNSIVVSQVTQQLAGEHFEYRDLGQHQVKGFADPVAAYQVVARREITRLQARGGALTPLVGRQEEVALILDRWERAASGHGQVVALVGQAGIGKSRITAEAVKQIAERDGSAIAPIILQYSPYHANLPLYPIIRYIARIADISPSDHPATTLAKVTAVLGNGDPGRQDELSLIADLLGGEQDNSWEPRLNPITRRNLTIEALARYFADRGQGRPVLVVLEDVQWIDPTSKLLLARLANWAPSGRALIVITSRPYSRSRADGFLRDTRIVDTAGRYPDHVTIREIREMTAEEGRRLANATRVAGGGLDPMQLDAVLAKSAGIPLYIEELAKAAAAGFDIPASRGSADDNVVPHTISDALMAQLDRLGEAKHAAQCAAVIGQEFPLGLLAEITHRSFDDLVPLLDCLIDAGIFVPGGSLFEGYRFKHALIRDIAYRSLLRKNRRQIHCAVARNLSQQALGAVTSDLIAQHYSLGAAHGEAIAFWQRGAAAAIARSANEEAIAMLASALAELPQLRGMQQPELELELILAHAAALRSVRGYSAVEVEEQLARAQELCAICGDAETKFSVEWGLFLCMIVKGSIVGARALAESLLDQTGNEPGPRRVDALLANGMVAFNAGEFEVASQFLLTGAELSGPETDEPRFLTHGQNAGLFCLSYLARTQILLGQIDRARASIERALAIAADRGCDPGHIHSHINVAIHAVRVYHHCDDLAAEKHFAEKVVALARRNHYAYYQALGTCHLGWVTGREGDLERGIAILEEGMSGLTDTGTFLSIPGFQLLLAELHLRAGNIGEAKRSLSMAVGAEGFTLWDAEIERVRGDILARETCANCEAIETAYRLSLEIARRQQAGLLICKAGLSLARLLETRERCREAYELLKDCMATLKDDGNLPIVRQAQSMMQELATAV